MKTLLSIALLLAIPTSLWAGDQNQHEQFNFSSSPGGHGSLRATWDAEAGYAFFVLFSDSLDRWTYLPFVTAGTDTERSLDIRSNATSLFLCLVGHPTTSMDPAAEDFDLDTIPTWMELDLLGSDPLADNSTGEGPTDQFKDTDSDGIIDLEEVLFDLGRVGFADTDEDGLTDFEERQLGSNPFSSDTDGDGILDDVDLLIHTANSLITDPTPTRAPRINILTPTARQVRSL